MASSTQRDYDVEKIVSKRIDETGRSFYLIKWKGYSKEDNTWEPEDHVVNCQKLIDEFEERAIKSKFSKVSRVRAHLIPLNDTSRRIIRRSGKRISSSSNQSSETSTQVKRRRKSTTDTDVSLSTQSHVSDILDKARLDRIIDVRRKKKNNHIEYYIRAKKAKQPIWISSTRLAEEYSQEIIDFLEDKYI